VEGRVGGGVSGGRGTPLSNERQRCVREGGGDGSRRVVWKDPREGAIRGNVDAPTFAGASIVGGGESLLQRSKMLVHNMLKITKEGVELYRQKFQLTSIGVMMLVKNSVVTRQSSNKFGIHLSKTIHILKVSSNVLEGLLHNTRIGESDHTILERGHINISTSKQLICPPTGIIEGRVRRVRSQDFKVSSYQGISVKKTTSSHNTELLP
jgi:hypothetical protein